MRILVLGDVVGRPGRRAIRELVPDLSREEHIDLVIANAENAAGGMGVDVKSAEELFAGGIHVLTSGNHIWKKKEIFPYLASQPRLLRPANYPGNAPGRGWVKWTSPEGVQVLVINLQGRVFMPAYVDDPFRCAEEVLRQQKHDIRIVLVDMHAEATSEKNAIGWFLDGRVSAVFGTHTHVQTADDRILPGGTAFISDLGMCGPWDSVIGIETRAVIEGFLTQLPRKFEVAEENVILQGIIVEVDESTGKARDLRRIRLHWEQ
jgi:metallophosphoesterase (TIGR00282 family)